MRKPHTLSQIKKTTTPTAVIWFDTETKNVRLDDQTVTNKLDYGWACYKTKTKSGGWSNGRWCRFTTPSQFYTFIESVCRPKTKTIIYCHNTNFDLPIIKLFTSLPRRGWTLNKAIIEAPPTIIEYSKKDVVIEYQDTLNIFAVPLAKIGENVGLQKLNMPDEDQPQSVKDIYCKRDVDIIMLACINWWQFIEQNDLGSAAPTLAGQALKSYRHKFMSTEIYIDCNEPALKLSRAAYLGGRCEAYKTGHIKNPVTCLDINSMYPYVMREMYYPTAVCGHTKHATINDVEKWCAEKCVVARVLLDTDEPAYGVRSKTNIYFPVGQFMTTLTTPDLKFAIARGHVVHIDDVAIYNRAKLFTSYVNYFYTLRLKYISEGNNFYAGLCKLLLNSLYGKFGQNGLVYEPDRHIKDLASRAWLEFDLETGATIRWRQLGGLLQRRAEEAESRESHPAIAAHVTAYARAYLYKLQNIVGRDNVVYSDTDSIYTDAPLNQDIQKYIDPGELGLLKIEKENQRMVIHGAKDYTLTDTYRCKGAKKNALWTDKDTFEQLRWSSLRGQCRAGELDTQKITDVTKHLSRVYNKGVVHNDGLITPLRLSITN